MPNFGPINGAPINGGAGGAPRRVRSATIARAAGRAGPGRARAVRPAASAVFATIARAAGRADPRNAEAL